MFKGRKAGNTYSESHEGGRGTIPLIVGNNIDSVILVDADARVGGAQIDTNRWSHDEGCYEGKRVCKDKGNFYSVSRRWRSW